MSCPNTMMCPCSSFSDRAAWIYWQPIMSFLCLNTHMMMHYGTLLSNHYLVIIPLLATTWWILFCSCCIQDWWPTRHEMCCQFFVLFISRFVWMELCRQCHMTLFPTLWCLKRAWLRSCFFENFPIHWLFFDVIIDYRVPMQDIDKGV